MSNVLRLPQVFSVILLFAFASLAHAADPPLPTIPATNFNILSFGGFGDGASNNATAINNAISAANTAGGGTVEIPANGTLSTYMSGPITLKSSVNLQIDTNAMLKMLPKSTYPSSSTPFILGSSLHDCEITGGGTIDGQYSTWGGNDPRPNFIEYDHTLKILLQGVTLQNPPKFHIMVHNNNGDLTIQNITINTPGNTANTDGIDLASTNVLIRNCFISDGDDNIQIGSSSAFGRNITISNCTFGTGHGLSIGSPTQGGVSNLLVNNCTWNGTEYGLHIKTDRTQGGLIQSLTYQNLIMSNVNFAIAFYMHYDTIGSPSSSINVPPSTPASDPINNVGTLTPMYRNITISNVTVYAIGGNIAGIIWGLPESIISNVTLTGVNIAAPTKTFCVYDATGIQFINSNLTAPNTTTNTLTLYNAGITLTNNAANTNVVTFTGLGTPSNSVLSVFNGLVVTRDASVLGANPLLTLAGSTLTVSNNMSLGGSSRLNYGLGTNVTKTAATGNLTLGGTLNVADAGGFNTGTYTLFSYGGALTYNGVTIGTTPNTNFTYAIDTNTAGLVKLDVTGAVASPIASFNAVPTTGAAPLAVTFTDTSMGSITNLFWDFGDSSTTNTAVGVGFGHTYTAVGTYTVTLIASGPGGAGTNIQSSLITVLDPFVAWQLQYFSCTNCAQAAPDSDPFGKGMSNTNQFLAGLNPTNTASALRIISAIQQSGDVLITWTTAGAHTNAVQATTGDGSGGYATNFADISGLIIITGNGDATTNYTDAGGATNSPSRYYRIRLVP